MFYNTYTHTSVWYVTIFFLNLHFCQLICFIFYYKACALDSPEINSWLPQGERFMVKSCGPKHKKYVAAVKAELTGPIELCVAC